MATDCPQGDFPSGEQVARISGNGFDVDSNLVMFVQHSDVGDLDVPTFERTKFRTDRHSKNQVADCQERLL